MNLRVLDTDHISLILRGDRRIIDRLQSLDKSKWAVTIISIQEVFNGWVVKLNDPRFKDQQVALYTLADDNLTRLDIQRQPDTLLVPFVIHKRPQLIHLHRQSSPEYNTCNRSLSDAVFCLPSISFSFSSLSVISNLYTPAIFYPLSPFSLISSVASPLCFGIRRIADREYEQLFLQVLQGVAANWDE